MGLTRRRKSKPLTTLRRALRASDLRPTPAELLEVWRRIRAAGEGRG